MDAYLIRSRLEMELDIEVLILDDLTIQTVPFVSNTIGGVRIQVREDQVEIARKFLIENEYLKLEERKPNKLLNALTKFTLKIPELNRLEVEPRILIFSAFVLMIIVIPIVIVLNFT